jgi:hypothetical protein
VTGPNPDDTYYRAAREQRQRPEVPIMREDDSSLPMGLLQELGITPPLPSLLQLALSVSARW